MSVLTLMSVHASLSGSSCLCQAHAQTQTAQTLDKYQLVAGSCACVGTDLLCLLRGEPQGVATVTDTDAQGGVIRVIHLHFRHGPEKGEKHTSGICIEALERF